MNYLTSDQLTKIEFPKWPSCNIQGHTVTPQQALDIRLRTCGWLEGDNAVESTYYSAIPKPEWEPKWWLHRTGKSISRKRQYRKEMGNLGLQYLSNDVTGGPDACCNWKGDISYHNYLVQCKDPTPLELFGEWQVIAAAFPYLVLTCRVFTEEYTTATAESGKPTAVVYYVAHGTVKVSAINPKLRTEEETLGKTLKFWTQACQTVAAQFKNEP
jgi:hypothetical protein